MDELDKMLSQSESTKAGIPKEVAMDAADKKGKPSNKKTAKKDAKKIAKRKTAKKAGKTAKRKTAKKAPRNFTAPAEQTLILSKPIPDDFWESDDEELGALVDDVQEGISAAVNIAKTKAIRVRSRQDLMPHVLPFRDMALQYLFECVGLRRKVVVDVVGEEGCGKSTFLTWMAGQFALMGVFTIYVECEEKPIPESRRMSILHPNKKIAAKLREFIIDVRADQLMEADHAVEKLLPQIRERSDKHPVFGGKPIIVIYDTWTTLKSSAEASGRSQFGMTAAAKKKVKRKEIGDATNFGHSKHAASLKRTLPGVMSDYDAIFFFARHQNVKLPDMTGGPPVMFKPSEAKNDTATGGRGIKSLAAYQIIMVKNGEVTDKETRKVKYTRTIVNCNKNTFGEAGHEIELRILKGDKRPPTATMNSDVFDLDAAMAKVLVREKIGDIRLKDGLYTSKELNVTAVEGKELMTAIRKFPEWLDQLGVLLGIEGYFIPEQPKGAAEVPTDAEEPAEPTDGQEGQ